MLGKCLPADIYIIGRLFELVNWSIRIDQVRVDVEHHQHYQHYQHSYSPSNSSRQLRYGWLMKLDSRLLTKHRQQHTLLVLAGVLAVVLTIWMADKDGSDTDLLPLNMGMSGRAKL